VPAERSRIAALTPASESGDWQRHVASAYVREALEGRSGHGRWGTRGGFPVLYLGRPRDSVVVEAYRHLVDPIEDPADRARLTAQIRPRVLVTAAVRVTNLLDLRSVATRIVVGLTDADLTSATDDAKAYRRCQEVAHIAHHLGRHGIIAPAATGLGETLALFTDVIPAAERPVRIAEADEHWTTFPDDPRASRQTPRARLRLVRNDD
jgi:hypothetical protein